MCERREAEIRARSEPRLRDELREAKSLIRAEYNVRIEDAVQAAVLEAELSAHEEHLGRLEPYRQADIADEADAIQARYELWIQDEIATRLAAQERRHVT
jgi:hypothetical protein